VSLGNFVVVLTSQSVLTQTSIVQRTTHLFYILQPIALGYKPVQHVTVLITVGNCNTMVNITIS